VQEYSRSVDQLTTLLATISTNFTMVSAASPIHLPGPLSKSLNTDIKHVTGSILPGLENLFLESKTCIEQRLVRDVYPSFVKHQLSLATSRALVSDKCLREAEFPGLGGAFCITDVALEGAPIEFVSDEFLRLTGRRREQVLHRNGSFLQGPLTDLAGVFRIREVLSRDEECIELLINHLDDGTPFWNFSYICPIPAPGGKVRYYLHGYINVSNCIRNSDDIIQIINSNPVPSDTASERSVERRGPYDRRGSTSQESDYEGARGRGENVSRSKSTRKPFFRSFRKNSETSTSSQQTQNQQLQRPDTAYSTINGNQVDGALPPLTENLVSDPPRGLPSTPYSRFILLKNTPGFTSPKLAITFATQAALDLLNLGLAAEAIHNKDIFTVLAEQANCVSITKAFRTSVRETVLLDGRQAVADIRVAAPAAPRKGNLMGGLGWGSEDQGSVAGARRTVLSTFWTPLKDGEEKPAWVMLVLLPSL